MTTTMYLTRAHLRREVPISAIRARIAAGHRLVWTLFADKPERERDFLWRETEPGLFYLLSTRQPEDRHALFDMDPPKPFMPTLAPGDRLAFILRVNATVARVSVGKPGANGRVRGGRCDVVMDALRSFPAGTRAEARRSAVARVACDWLARQGAKHGFVLPPAEQDSGRADGSDRVEDSCVRVVGYDVWRLDRGPRREDLQIGVLDIEGVLEVRDPAVFVAALSRGFGRAKAFGCGLMLVRRVPSPL